MIILAIGVALWAAAHLFKRVAPAARTKMGDQGRAVTGILALAALGLMVFGYRSAEGTYYWGRSPALVGVNNLIMLVAVYFFAAAGMKTALSRKIRHPMLWGVVLWMIAHILVNGDTPSFVLFGGIGLWALVQMAVINQTEEAWVPPQPKAKKLEWIAILGTLVVYGAIAGVHYAFGYPAFG